LRAVHDKPRREALQPSEDDPNRFIYDLISRDTQLLRDRTGAVYDCASPADSPWNIAWGAGVSGDPRRKAHIRRIGLLDLWRTRGFPARCRPLDGDDFECDEPLWQ